MRPPAIPPGTIISLGGRHMLMLWCAEYEGLALYPFGHPAYACLKIAKRPA